MKKHRRRWRLSALLQVALLLFAWVMLLNALQRRRNALERLAALEMLESRLADQVRALDAAKAGLSERRSPQQEKLSLRGARSTSLSLGAAVELLESVIPFEDRFPPNKQGLVAVLGVDFIMKRDFEIWDYTFTRAHFDVVKTSKKKMQRGDHSNWRVLKCLDLFDGKSHCIEPKQLLTLKPYQRVSRLYGLRNTLWSKDSFCETMSQSLRGLKISEEFVFPCWMLPRDYDIMIRQAKNEYSSKSFILKPTDRGEGNGIVVVDNWRKLARWKENFPDLDEAVVQTYLPNPFLINERKWDMRTYVLVTNVHPLRAYMYRDGLVRFASSKYDKKSKGGGGKTSILTNTSINKKSGMAVDELTWPFPKVYRWLRANNFDPDLLWKKIEYAVAQMLLSAEPGFAKQFAKLQRGFTCANCYQLLGVDVIVDDDVVPRVIEVNGEPSMQLTGELNSHYDYTKKSMARDLAQLVFSQQEGVASGLASDLMELELEGFMIGYEDSKQRCEKSSHDFCLSKSDLAYLLEMKREELVMGGFRRLYPRKDGRKFDALVHHLRSKFPGDARTGSFQIHEVATELAKLSKIKTSNAIDDPNYVPS